MSFAVLFAAADATLFVCDLPGASMMVADCKQHKQPCCTLPRNIAWRLVMDGKSATPLEVVSRARQAVEGN